jgi:hypothetical protein
VCVCVCVYVSAILNCINMLHHSVLELDIDRGSSDTYGTLLEQSLIWCAVSSE